MKEKIESKIEAHVLSVLEKDVINYEDYQILVGELSRISAKEQAEKWEAEKQTRMETMIKALASV